jgi:hypothetical protein
MKVSGIKSMCALRCALVEQSLLEIPRRFVSLSEGEVMEADCVGVANCGMRLVGSPAPIMLLFIKLSMFESLGFT